MTIAVTIQTRDILPRLVTGASCFGDQTYPNNGLLHNVRPAVSISQRLEFGAVHAYRQFEAGEALLYVLAHVSQARDSPSLIPKLQWVASPAVFCKTDAPVPVLITLILSGT